MRWHVNEFSTGTITGWVYDEKKPKVKIVVAAVHGDRLLGMAVADQRSCCLPPDVFAVRADCCFSLTFEQGSFPEDFSLISLNWPEESPGLILFCNDESKIGQILSTYQKFSNTGVKSFSESDEKMERLQLPDLKGLSVLDIGCNEGFFCFQALEKGARRVVGIDRSNLFVEKARVRGKKYKNLPGRLEFRCGSWWDLPSEKFDVILFMSAIHYELRQKKLLEHLHDYLSDDGLLVLECGVLRNYEGTTLKIARPRDSIHFPGEAYLKNSLLSGYAVQAIGQSTPQAGDPVPRYVYHCTPKKTTVVVVRGASGAGKTVLLNMLGKKGVASFSSDFFMSCYMKGNDTYVPPSTQLYEVISNLDDAQMGLAAEQIVAIGAVEEFCTDFLECLPWHEEVFFIEGDIFRHAPFYEALLKELYKKRCVVWEAQRCI